MGVQQHGSRPYRRFRKRGSCVLRIHVVQYDTVTCELVQIRREVHLRVVRTQIIRPHGVDYEYEDIRPLAGGGSELLNQPNIVAHTGVPDIRVLAQDAAEISASFISGVAEDVVSELEGIIVTGVFLELQGNVIVGGAERFAPENSCSLNAFVDQPADY